MSNFREVWNDAQEPDEDELEWSSNEDYPPARLFALLEELEEEDDEGKNTDADIALKTFFYESTDLPCDMTLREVCRALVALDTDGEDPKFRYTEAAADLLEPIVSRVASISVSQQHVRMLEAAYDELAEKLSKVKEENTRFMRERDQLRRTVPEWATKRISYLEGLVSEFRNEQCNLKERNANLIAIAGKKDLNFDAGLKEMDKALFEEQRAKEFLQKRNDKLVEASRRRDALIAELSAKLKENEGRFRSIKEAAGRVAADFNHNEGVYRVLEARFEKCVEAYQVADAHRFKLMELSSVASKKIAELRKDNADLRLENDKLKQDLQLERMANTFEWQLNMDEFAFPKEMELHELFCDEELQFEEEPKSRKRRSTHAAMSTRPSKI